MEGERGAAILVACHVGATTRWLAVLACAIIGSEKRKVECAGKDMEVAANEQDPWGSEEEGGGVRVWAMKAEHVRVRTEVKPRRAAR